MSTLLNSAEGRNLVLEAQKYLLRRRLSRFFKRNLVIDIDGYHRGAHEFDLAHTLGDLNPAHDNDLLEIYRLLGVVGGLEETLADMEFWVNPTTGSDVTGTGSFERPYASLWFLNRLPRRIAHNVRIILSADVEYDGDIVIDNTFVGENGFLSIIGRGAPTVAPSGDHVAITVTTLDGLGGVAVVCFDALEDENSGWWLQTLDGAKPYYAVPVHTKPVAGTAICRRMPISTMLAGDHFRLIKPSRTLTINGSLTIAAKGTTINNNFDGRGSRVVFANLNIDLDSGAFGYYEKLVIDSTCKVNMTFVNLPSNILEVYIRSELNTSSAVDDDLLGYSQCGVENLDHEVTGIIPRMAGLLVGEFKADAIDAWIQKNATVYSTDFHCGVNVSGNSSVYHSAGITYELHHHHGVCEAILADGIDGAGPNGAAFALLNADSLVNYIDVLGGDNLISIDNSRLTAGLVCADAVYSSVSWYGVAFLGVGSAEFYDDPTGCVGITANIGFLDHAVAATSAHPAVWGIADDGTEVVTYVKRLGL